MTNLFTTIEERSQFNYITDQLSETFDCSTDEGYECACSHCPYAQDCNRREMFYACVCWEESMGDDL